MKPGDKVKCIQMDALLEVGQEYTLVENTNAYQEPNRPIVAIDQGKYGIYTYYADHFELVVTEDRLEIITKLCALAQSYIGETVDSGHRSWKIDSYDVFLIGETARKSSATVCGHFNTHGYCVAVKGGGRSVPVENVKILPTSKTIQLTDDYEAVIKKDHIIVGCQTISREKLQELLKIQDGFQ